MIQKINTNSVNSSVRPPQAQPQFKGMFVDGVLSAIQLCEQQPMVNVAVLDLATAIVPRTVVESETNAYAGLEAFRREASGLFINCIIPSFIVMGIAKAVERPIMGGVSKMSNSWANSDTVKMITEEWEKAPSVAKDKSGKILYEAEPQKAKAYNTIKSILAKTEGADGAQLKSFKGMDFDESLKKLTDKAFVEKYTKADRNVIAEAYKNIIDKTHSSEHIKIKGHLLDQNGKEKYFSQNLESVVKETPRVLRELVSGNITDFAKRSHNLVNVKSLVGLGVILPLAVAAQPINRWITAKTSGKKGAPIYKDFAQSKTKELTGKEKSDLFKQKMISVGSMIGVALLSMGGKLPRMKVLQFKSIFPTMDQARIISTATFASRMMASEDKNDLREATVRDIATFSAFYFLGDYVAKGVATLIEKKSKSGVKLINVLNERKPNANIFEKIVHWTKDTSLKSSQEVYGATEKATKYAQKMRSVCQLSNIVFSLLALGIVIPKMYRSKTDQKRAEELTKMGEGQNVA